MAFAIFIGLLVAAIVVPLTVFYAGGHTAARFKRCLGANVSAYFILLVVATVAVFSGAMPAGAAETATAAAAGGAKFGDFATGMAFLGAAISTGLGSIGAGVATGQAASAALGALSENEGLMGRAIIFVGLAEGVAIYGLIVAFMILGRV